MSGHSKWSTIKHKKGAADAKRGKLFSKLSRAIMVAAKEGGSDPATNLALQNAVEKARSYSMPKDNIERAIAKGAGEGTDGASFETVVYEGYGPEGVAVIVEALTDNRNRTASEVRHMFSKHGGNLGATGAVAWQFERRGVVLVSGDDVDEDELVLAAADAGADDVERDGTTFVVSSSPDELAAVRQALEAAGFTLESAGLSMVPKTTVAIGDESTAKQVVRLVEGLEEFDDVQDVYANFDIPETVLEAVRLVGAAAGVRLKSDTWGERRPRPCVPSAREGPRYRPRDGCVRVRDRPRKRRACQSPRPRVLDVGRTRAPGAPAQDDLRRSRRAHPGARAGRGRAGGVVRRCRRPHRALRRAGARRRPRRGRVGRGRVHRVRACARQAGGLWVRAGGQGADGENGEDAARARVGAADLARG